jgi:hypothetical protein
MRLQYIPFLSYLTALVFGVLAYRGWAKTARPQLPLWRSGIGIASITITLANWLFVLLIALLNFIDTRWTNFLDGTWINCLILSLLAAALLAVIMPGTTRLYGTAAGISMLAFWLTSFAH